MQGFFCLFLDSYGRPQVCQYRLRYKSGGQKQIRPFIFLQILRVFFFKFCSEFSLFWRESPSSKGARRGSLCSTEDEGWWRGAVTLAPHQTGTDVRYKNHRWSTLGSYEQQVTSHFETSQSLFYIGSAKVTSFHHVSTRDTGHVNWNGFPCHTSM
jgi:hypothetical protein